MGGLKMSDALGKRWASTFGYSDDLGFVKDIGWFRYSLGENAEGLPCSDIAAHVLHSPDKAWTRPASGIER